jgi:hypothetical protein
MVIDGSDDNALIGVRRDGSVRAYDLDEAARTRLLIQLDGQLFTRGGTRDRSLAKTIAKTTQ